MDPKKYEISPNVIIVDKPLGITSFDVIRKLRRLLNIRKMGHAGTLDPRASGLMIIALNEATKKLTEYLKLQKEYEAEVLLGTSTDSGDLDGKVLEKLDVLPEINEKKIREVIGGLVGINELPVSIYSALKKNGRPLYDYARKGEAVEVPIKKMEVLEAEILEIKLPIIKIRFKVASGTYIRSLAEEIGKRLDVPATLGGLRRTKIADWKVEDAMSIV